MRQNYFLSIFLISFLSFGQFQNSSNLNEDKSENSLYTAQINEIEGFSVYPNPITNGIFRISFTRGMTKEIRLYDMLGKLVLEKNVKRGEIIKVHRLNPGVYILKVIEEDKSVTRKLVIE